MFYNCLIIQPNSILEINSKILIFHAEDDWHVPYQHGFILNEIAQHRAEHLPPVELVSFGKEFGLGHYLYSHKSIYTHIK
jgi:hypothetical protein